MSFISYAQNFEDVILRRAFNDLEKGFYIDVGANDPVLDSVTKAFYESGWRGINIEPVNEWFEKLKQDRPEDINLQLIAGVRKGTRNFYEVVGTGLSTLNRQFAKRHSDEHGYEIRTYQVEVLRLTTICEMHPHPELHFLKIDVEGSEKSVLQGLDLRKVRPWIILIESTLPNSQEQDYDQWEYLITERNYHYVYFDGLNRYYVADEHSELDKAFLTPPNVFDAFRRAHEVKLEKHAQWLESIKSDATTNIQNLETQLQDEHVKVNQLDQRLREQITQTNTSLSSLKNKEAENLKLHKATDSIEKQNQILQVSITALEEQLQTKETEQQSTLLLVKDKKAELVKREAELLSLLYSLKEKQAANIEFRKLATSSEEQTYKLQNRIYTLETKFHKQAKEQEKALFSLENKLYETLSTLKETKAELDQTKEKLAEEWYTNLHTVHNLQAMSQSISWRITTPLRSVGGVIISAGRVTANAWKALMSKIRS